MKTRIAVALLVASTSVATGCASPTRVEKMVPPPMAMPHHFFGDVAVNVSGGQDTSALSTSQVSDEAFKAAIEQAIAENHLFTAMNATTPRYHLDVVITQVGQPMAGLDMSVTFTANWKLWTTNAGQPIWTDFIAAKHVTKFGESLVGIERLRIATEGAARENIAQAVQAISDHAH